MPELPDIAVYTECLQRHASRTVLQSIRIAHPFVLRTVRPSIQESEGRSVCAIRRIGKRVVIALAGEIFIVLHLMVAGRLYWVPPNERTPRRGVLAHLAFERGTLIFTEAGSKRRASLHIVQGDAALRALDPGGIEILETTAAEFLDRLRRGNHTLKRALTDPHLFSGIGNAYSDEILHRARLSPFALSGQLTDAQAQGLFVAAKTTLTEWLERLRKEAAGGWPQKVTAFREAMAVHGRYGEACPDCGAPVQHIVYADNETNYCARCQTGGKVLADRALSRLLKSSWPRNIDELG